MNGLQLLCSTRASVFYGIEFRDATRITNAKILLLMADFISHEDEKPCKNSIAVSWGVFKNSEKWVNLLMATPLAKFILSGVKVPNEPTRKFELFWKRCGAAFPNKTEDCGVDWGANRAIDFPRLDLGTLFYPADVADSIKRYSPAPYTSEFAGEKEKSGKKKKDAVARIMAGVFRNGMPVVPLLATECVHLPQNTDLNQPEDPTHILHPWRMLPKDLIMYNDLLRCFEVQIGSSRPQVFCGVTGDCIDGTADGSLLIPISKERLPRNIANKFTGDFPVYYMSGISGGNDDFFCQSGYGPADNKLLK